MSEKTLYVLQYLKDADWIDLDKDYNFKPMEELYLMNVKQNKDIENGFKFRLLEKSFRDEVMTNFQVLLNHAL